MKPTIAQSSKSLAAIQTRRHRKASGFTLIEITVVLTIAAIVTAITMGGFHEMREGHKRTACQTNMMQVYQALRLYAADENGKFPHFNMDCSAAIPTHEGIGLWSLYTYPQVGNPDNIAVLGQAPTERYLRSAKALHCPNDYSHQTDGYINTQLMDESKTTLNPEYLSYQRCDGGEATYSTSPLKTSTSATNTTTDINGALAWKRQLLPFKQGIGEIDRPAADDTIIMWCRWHRSQRNFDNVLFYDGSIQLRQAEPSLNWLRVPKPPA